MKIYLRKILLILLDVFIINTSIFIALFFRFNGAIPDDMLGIYMHAILITTIAKIVIYWLFGFYRSLWRYAGEKELIQIFFGTLIGASGHFIFALLTDNLLPRTVYIASWILTFIFISGSRLSYRLLRRRKNHTYCKDESLRTMIVGAGSAAAKLINDINIHPNYKVIPVLAVDDDKNKIGCMIHGIPIRGDRNDIKHLVEKYRIQKIIIALPSAHRVEIAKILEICKGTKCRLKIIPDMEDIISGKVSIKLRDVNIEDLLRRDEVLLNNNEITSYVKNKVVFVTGGGGSIGSEICRQIAKIGPAKLIVLDIYENNAYELQQELLSEYKNKLDLVVLIGSIRDEKKLDQIFSEYKPDVVFHAAAYKHVPLMEVSPKEAVKNNVFGTLNTAQIAKKHGAKKFVLISTDKAVNPTNIMGATKRMAEMIIQAMNENSETEFVSVRFGNVLGSNGSVLPLFKKQIEKGGPVLVTHPEMTRFFMTPTEAAQLVIYAGSIAKGGETFILDMGKPVKIVDLAKDLIKLSGLEVDKDIKIEYIGLRPGEKLYEELLINEQTSIETSNKKIFIDKPTNIDNDEIKKKIEKLSAALNNPECLRACLHEVVPSYTYIKDAIDEENDDK